LSEVNRRFEAILSGRSILILGPGVPHPHEGASTVLFYQYIRGLAEAGARLLHVMLTDGTNRNERLRGEYLASMHDQPAFAAVECPLERMYSQNRWTRAPQVQTLPAPTVDRVKAFRPDLVVCLDLLAAAYALQIDTRDARVIWLGDLNFETFWYNAWYDAKERWVSAVRLPLTVLACAQWRRFYRLTLHGARAVIVSSKASEGALHRLGLKSTYLPYPWPAKVETGRPVEKPSRPAFAFFGSLSGLGSRSAFDTLINTIYPQLVRTWGTGGFTVFLAGTRQAPRWVQSALQDRPEIVFQGFVADLVSFMRACHAVVVPIDVPVGNRSRILTAMAHGSLVVAHRNTTAGNPDLVSGVNCLLAASAEEFAKHLRFAVESPAEALRIARQGQATYERLFSPRPATERFIAVVRAGLNERPQPISS
jgi:glycosyltransferase involved in cell wall biosynthesis